MSCSRPRQNACVTRAPPPAEPAAPITLRLTGVPRCRRDDGSWVELASLDALLLAWLALEGPTPRERLAGLLWPAADGDSGRNALRQRLFRLRRLCGRDLATGSAVLALAEAERHDLDTDPGLLSEWDAADLPALNDWLDHRRQLRRADAARRLATRVEALEQTGDLSTALDLALEMVEADPLSEEAHRRVMRLHYLRGDRSAAARAFDRLESLLKHEVGTRPSSATLELLQTIEQDSGPDARPPHRGTELPAAVLRPPRLIGRERERAALDQGFRAGQRMLVIGEAGMGKSRLVQAVAETFDALVLASARPGDTLVPYASLARLFQELRARVPGSLTEELRQSLAPLLPGVARPSVRPSRRGSLAGPAQAWLQSVAPVVDGFVLDDLHFADDASLDLLQELLTRSASGGSRGWALGLRPPARPSRLATLVDTLAGTVPVVTVAVRPLELAQTRELVDSLALPGLPAERVAPGLQQRTGGNPLFLLETLRQAWAEGGFDPADTLPRPASLSQLIRQQLARLSAPALALARLAAIAGSDFELALAEQVLGQSALQLADPWHELEAQQVMIGDAFAHDLIHEAVLEGVPAVIARHLHGQVAAYLEAAGGEPARVAAHWEAAGRRERALPGLQAAADRAHRALREAERIGFLLRAADIAEATGASDEAYLCVAQAIETHMNSIRQADGVPLLDRLEALSRTPLQQARALGLRAWYCSQLGDDARAIDWGRQALARAEGLGDAMLTGQIRQRLATALAMNGRFDDALPHFEALQDWAADHLATEDLSEFHGNFAVTLDNLGHPERARPHHDRAIDASAQAGDHAQRATQLANQAVNRLNAGRVDEAAVLVLQAQQVLATFELSGSSAAFAAVLQMQVARARGHYREALEVADHAEALLSASLPARVPVVHLHRAHVWLDLGQHARAGQDLRAAGQRGPLPAHIESRRRILLARLQRLAGARVAGALEEARRALPAKGWPEMHLIWVAEQAAALPPDATSLAEVDAALGTARELGLRGSELALLLRRASMLARLDPARAAEPARQAWALAGSVEPSMLYRGERWLAVADALRAAGDLVIARQRRDEGRSWVHAVADAHVAPEHREAFLARNPVNAGLLSTTD